ncbi:TetR/AcrR family transcriptional regulator [Propionicicella superfundia]|uniref:TetR/AcrR family transcriptional regulator n=1 Tax=Propionicicella superfundia TaxID=348582 RepID=UPI0003FC7DA8|nr:TetR/AcrR family transcriptional regulator [Propionicicella superfundia]
MPSNTRTRNRGPAAAKANRAAILAAARRVFAEQGYRAPLSTIARTAGVGQGVLYRHFPDRRDLGLAVFEENFAELERLASSTPGPDCFHTVWRLLVEYILESSAIIEMVIDARAALPPSLSDERLRRLIADPLARAQEEGLADPGWAPADILLMALMVYGVVVSQTNPADAPGAVSRALHLIDPRLT